MIETTMLKELSYLCDNKVFYNTDIVIRNINLNTDWAVISVYGDDIRLPYHNIFIEVEVFQTYRNTDKHISKIFVFMFHNVESIDLDYVLGLIIDGCEYKHKNFFEYWECDMDLYIPRPIEFLVQKRLFDTLALISHKTK